MKSYKEKRFIVCRESRKWDSPIYVLDTSLKFEKFISDYSLSYLKFKYKRLAQEVASKLNGKNKNPDNNYFVDEIWI